MRTVWAWLIISRVHRLIEDVRVGAEADREYRETTQTAPLMVSEAVSRAASVYGINLPLADAQMLAVLRRMAEPCPVDSPPYGAMVLLNNGRMGMVTEGGLVESHGSGLSIVGREPGRWVEAWLLPDVLYLNGRK